MPITCCVDELLDSPDLTPREYVAWIFLIARNADAVDDAEEILADMRATLVRIECGSEAPRS